MTAAVELACSEFGNGPAVVLLHGLLGNGRNLQALAHALADRHRVLTPDLRNHGRSPHTEVMDYPSLAADVVVLLERYAIDTATLIGHSLGGKVAMATTLMHPDRVERLAVLDMAPVRYAKFFEGLLDSLKALPLEALQCRKHADEQLASVIEDQRLRTFLLQNLIRTQNGFRWRVNLDTLQQQRLTLAGFPDTVAPWAGPALFLHGELSDYLRHEHYTAIKRLFPGARIEAVADAGHWLHADQPDAVATRLRCYLTA